MTMTIYQFDNKATEIQLPDKEIQEIFIIVLSGDETGTVTFTDGSVLPFDASDSRIMDFIDHGYSVTGGNIEKWLSFGPKDGRTAAYQRAYLFSGEEAAP